MVSGGRPKPTKVNTSALEVTAEADGAAHPEALAMEDLAVIALALEVGVLDMEVEVLMMRMVTAITAEAIRAVPAAIRAEVAVEVEMEAHSGTTLGETDSRNTMPAMTKHRDALTLCLLRLVPPQ